MKVGKTNRFGMQLVEVRRANDRIARAAQISIALIVGHYDDDIGRLGRETHQGG